MGRYLQLAAGAAGVAAACAVLGAAARQQRRKKLSGKIVLITGGSRGFGLALAREFAGLDCRLALLARDRQELQSAQAALPGHEVFTAVCDVADRTQVATALAAVIEHYGHIDVLINNAGEITVSPLENLTVDDFERAMSVMFWGMLHISLAVLPAMKARGQGRIVNVTSIGGKVTVPHLVSYSCAKAAAVAFSDGLRNEVRQFGVKVTTIVPGLMRTGSHVNASFKGDRVAEAAWFGVAASLPLLSLSAEQAACLAVDAVCTEKSEAILGLPAQILAHARTLMPGLTSEALRLSASLLPAGNDQAVDRQTGKEVDDRHGVIYRLLTTL
jgi:short-subunit dehydrogenase